jgi:hypothetical protein
VLEEEHVMLKSFLGAGIVMAVLAGAAQAQQVVKQEPRAGALRPGEKILVDNGKCPKGQVMEVSGGTRPSQAQMRAQAAAGGNVNAGGQARERRCVPRPS